MPPEASQALISDLQTGAHTHSDTFRLCQTPETVIPLFP